MKILLTFILISISLFAYNQTLTDAQIKAGYVYKFINYIKWPDEKKIDTFKIAVYGEDPEIIKALKSIEIMDFKKKPIKVTNYLDWKQIPKNQILYVLNEKNSDIPKLFNIIQGKSTLLITDRFYIQRYMMINFFYIEKKISFEVNSQNTKENLLQITPDILLLGGTEVDVRNLYLETEQTLKKEREKIEIIENELEDKKQELVLQTKNLSILKDEISVQKDKITDYEALVKNKTKQFEEVSKKTDEQKQLLIEKLEIVKQKETEINQLKANIEKHENWLKDKQKEVENFSKKLDEQKNEISNQISVIEKQDSVLKTQFTKIEAQRQALYLFIAVIILILILVVLIYRGYITKKNKNNELQLMLEEISRKNKEIELQSEEILAQSDNLKSVNTELETKKEQLEKALTNLKEAQTHLVDSEKMITLGQLTAGIAHEINNPVNYINTNIEGLNIATSQLLSIIDDCSNIPNSNYEFYIEQIKQKKKEIEYEELKSDIKSMIQDIKTGARKTSEIVKELRTFARIDEDDAKLIDIHQNIDSTLLILRNQYINKIEIIKDYGNIPFVECFPAKINQVFMNLINNAIQAISGNGNISIKTTSSLKNGIEYVIIKITDTGKGIPDNLKNKIFEPFFTTKEIGQGTGLGLSICKSIIDKHKGTIEVISEIGKGSTFIVNLPAKYQKNKK